MIHNTRNALFIALGCAIIGMIYFAFAHELIIIKHALNTTNHTITTHTIKKKQVTLTFWHQNAWKTETQDLLWTTQHERNIYQLVNAWLVLIDEEKVLHKKITLQSALVSPLGHTAYLSFDHNPLPKEASTFEKWMLLEGLLKTIRQNNVPMQHIQFLVHHQPLNDQHLDFSKPWPIHGFLS